MIHKSGFFYFFSCLLLLPRIPKRASSSLFCVVRSGRFCRLFLLLPSVGGPSLSRLQPLVACPGLTKLFSFFFQRGKAEWGPPATRDLSASSTRSNLFFPRNKSAFCLRAKVTPPRQGRTESEFSFLGNYETSFLKAKAKGGGVQYFLWQLLFLYFWKFFSFQFSCLAVVSFFPLSFPSFVGRYSGGDDRRRSPGNKKRKKKNQPFSTCLRFPLLKKSLNNDLVCFAAEKVAVSLFFPLIPSKIFLPQFASPFFSWERLWSWPPVS